MFTFYDQRPMSSINCNLLTFHTLLILFQGHLQFMMTFWEQRSSSILRIEKDKVIYIFLLVKFLFAGNSVWPRQKWWRDLSVQATMWQVIFKIFLKILSQYFKISLTTTTVSLETNTWQGLLCEPTLLYITWVGTTCDIPIRTISQEYKIIPINDV